MLVEGEIGIDSTESDMSGFRAIRYCKTIFENIRNKDIYYYYSSVQSDMLLNNNKQLQQPNHTQKPHNYYNNNFRELQKHLLVLYFS